MITLNTVFIKTYTEDELPFNNSEILRYARAREDSAEVNSLLSECIEEIRGKLSYRVCYAEYEIRMLEGEIDLRFAKVKSKGLEKNLKSSTSVCVFCATLGTQIDILIKRHSLLSPARALLLQAIGSERVETLCDKFNEEIKERARREGKRSHPRFSPGYGDLPLELQRDIFRALECPRKIGVSLSESLMMTPSKSVTAIIGISPEEKGTV